MGKILILSLGVVLTLAVAGCKSSGDSMGSMKMSGDNSTSPPATMPAGMK